MTSTPSKPAPAVAEVKPMQLIAPSPKLQRSKVQPVTKDVLATSITTGNNSSILGTFSQEAVEFASNIYQPGTRIINADGTHSVLVPVPVSSITNPQQITTAAMNQALQVLKAQNQLSAARTMHIPTQTLSTPMQFANQQIISPSGQYVTLGPGGPEGILIPKPPGMSMGNQQPLIISGLSSQAASQPYTTFLQPQYTLFNQQTIHYTASNVMPVTQGDKKSSNEQSLAVQKKQTNKRTLAGNPLRNSRLILPKPTIENTPLEIKPRETIEDMNMDMTDGNDNMVNEDFPDTTECDDNSVQNDFQFVYPTSMPIQNVNLDQCSVEIITDTTVKTVDSDEVEQNPLIIQPIDDNTGTEDGEDIEPPSLQISNVFSLSGVDAVSALWGINEPEKSDSETSDVEDFSTKKHLPVKRGRPRKNPIIIKPKRPVGRPRKFTTTESKEARVKFWSNRNAIVVKPKRPVGRPRKVQTTEKKILPEKRGPGRPRKVTLEHRQPSLSPTQTPSQTQTPTQAQTPTPTQTQTQTQTQAQTPTPTQTQKPTPTQTPTQTPTPNNPIVVKRGRGRPRKVNPFDNKQNQYIKKEQEEENAHDGREIGDAEGDASSPCSLAEHVKLFGRKRAVHEDNSEIHNRVLQHRTTRRRKGFPSKNDCKLPDIQPILAKNRPILPKPNSLPMPNITVNPLFQVNMAQKPMSSVTITSKTVSKTTMSPNSVTPFSCQTATAVSCSADAVSDDSVIAPTGVDSQANRENSLSSTPDSSNTCENHKQSEEDVSNEIEGDQMTCDIIKTKNETEKPEEVQNIQSEQGTENDKIQIEVDKTLTEVAEMIGKWKGKNRKVYTSIALDKHTTRIETEEKMENMDTDSGNIEEDVQNLDTNSGDFKEDVQNLDSNSGDFKDDGQNWDINTGDFKDDAQYWDINSGHIKEETQNWDSYSGDITDEFNLKQTNKRKKTLKRKTKLHSAPEPPALISTNAKKIKILKEKLKKFEQMAEDLQKTKE